MAPHPSTLAWKILAWQAAVHGVAKSQTWLSDFTFTSHVHALEKEMATHSGVLAWRIPGIGELPSMASHRVGHDWSDLAAAGSGIPKKGDSEKVATAVVHTIISPFNWDYLLPLFSHSEFCSTSLRWSCDSLTLNHPFKTRSFIVTTQNFRVSFRFGHFESHL